MITAKSAVILVWLVGLNTAGAQEASRLDPQIFVQRAGVSRSTVSVEDRPLIPRNAQERSDRPSATRYVVTGALIGAGLYVVGLWIYFSQASGSDVVVSNPVALVPAGLAAAAIGGFIGWVAYKAR